MTTEQTPKAPRKRRSRLNEVVISTLVTRIVSGQYRSGDRLPTEVELGDEFDVSRTVIREAAKVLEDKGLVFIRQGQGCTVLPNERWRVMDSDIISAQLEHDSDGRVLEDFTFVREALECAMAARAAARMTPELEARGRELLALGATHVADPDVFLEYDYAFHELVMEASGAALAFDLMKTLREPLHATRRMFNRIPGTIGHGQRGHEAIFRALVSGDAAGARAEMREHIEWLKAQIREGALVEAGTGDDAPSPGGPGPAGEPVNAGGPIGSNAGR
jgi:DNA-binding FadR family transcriptional regulator